MEKRWRMRQRKLINFVVSNRLKDEIHNAAECEGVSMSEFLRLSIHHYIKYLEVSKAEVVVEKKQQLELF